MFGNVDAFESRARTISLPRRIAVRVEHAVPAVGALAREGEAQSVLIEVRAPVDQLVDAARPLLDEHPHRLGIAQTVARGERVLLVQGDLVIFAERGGDAALRVLGVAVGGKVLGEEHDLALGDGDLDGGPQSGDPAADHDVIRGDGALHRDENSTGLAAAPARTGAIRSSPSGVRGASSGGRWAYVTDSVRFIAAPPPAGSLPNSPQSLGASLCAHAPRGDARRRAGLHFFLRLLAPLSLTRARGGRWSSFAREGPAQAHARARGAAPLTPLAANRRDAGRRMSQKHNLRRMQDSVTPVGAMDQYEAKKSERPAVNRPR